MRDLSDEVAKSKTRLRTKIADLKENLSKLKKKKRVALREHSALEKRKKLLLAGEDIQLHRLSSEREALEAINEAERMIVEVDEKVEETKFFVSENASKLARSMKIWLADAREKFVETERKAITKEVGGDFKFLSSSPTLLFVTYSRASL